MIAAPSPQFRTASHFLPAGATPRASSVSSAPLRAFYFFRAIFRALGTRLSLRVNSVQEPTRGLSKCFRSFSSLLSHASKETHGASEWNEKLFPKSTKVLVKVT